MDLYALALRAVTTPSLDAPGALAVLNDALLEKGLIRPPERPEWALSAAWVWATQTVYPFTTSPGRWTGKTTRIITAAVDVALRGETVCVMVSTEREQTRLDELARAEIGRRLHEVQRHDSPDAVWRRIYVETAESRPRHLQGRRVATTLDDRHLRRRSPSNGTPPEDG